MGLALVLALTGCEREARRFDTPPVATASGGRQVSLRAGPDAASATDAAEARHAPAATPPPGFKANAFAVAQGERWYRWFNCAGCHGSGGGGGMGPALTDATWRYGQRPGDIAQTVLQGRPNGMPSFAGRLNQEQLWQLVAYVRSLNGRLRTDVAPGRSDAISTGEPVSRRERQVPGRR